MILSLDANVVIDLMRGRAEVRRAYTRAEHEGLTFAASVLVIQELRFGAELSAHPEAEHRVLDVWLSELSPVPFELDDALTAAGIQAAMERQGRRAPYDDFLIGAHALARGQTLVTANTRHFSNIPGLRLLDWTQPDRLEQDDPHA